MSEGPIKIMYLAPLPDGRTHTAFRNRWRQHGRLGLSQPTVVYLDRYEHFDTLTPGELSLSAELLSPMATQLYGGVGALWIRSEEVLAELAQHPADEVMKADEPEAFGRLLGSDMVPSRPHNVIDGGAGPITLMGALSRRPELSRSRFADLWRDHGDKLARSPELTRHLLRHVQNLALFDPANWDGLFELDFATAAELEQFLVEPRWLELCEEAERRFVDAPQTVLLATRLTVLRDDASERG